jgi:SAM-dependent methyltransferase
MTDKINSFLRRLKNKIPGRDYVEVSGSIIPSPDRRWCGPEFKDNDFYLKSAEAEALRLIESLGCTQESRVLDIGCGQGRLPIGILRVIGGLDYLGIDVDRKSIDWCKRHIERNYPSFKFKHLNLYNERYSRDGVKIDESFSFNVVGRSVDIIYLYSVFSHMIERDMRIYLGEFSRILKENGRIFFSTFVEEHVPNFSVNPGNYRLACSGPLHIVRYQKDYLFSVIGEYGFSVKNFSHETEADGQSAVYLSKK